MPSTIVSGTPQALRSTSPQQSLVGFTGEALLFQDLNLRGIWALPKKSIFFWRVPLYREPYCFRFNIGQLILENFQFSHFRCVLGDLYTADPFDIADSSPGRGWISRLRAAPASKWMLRRRNPEIEQHALRGRDTLNSETLLQSYERPFKSWASHCCHISRFLAKRNQWQSVSSNLSADKGTGRFGFPSCLSVPPTLKSCLSLNT